VTVAGDLIEDIRPPFNEEDLQLFGLMKTAGVCRASLSLSLRHLHPGLTLLPSHLYLCPVIFLPHRSKNVESWSEKLGCCTEHASALSGKRLSSQYLSTS
jgi:hypothetical protein